MKTTTLAATGFACLMILAAFARAGDDGIFGDNFEWQPPRFITTWDTNLINGTTIELHFGTSGTSVDIDWGDGSSEKGATGPMEHTYATDGVCTVTTIGTFSAYGCNTGCASTGVIRALLSVDEWGPTGTTSLRNAFRGGANLTSVAEPPQTVTNMHGMFNHAASFNQDINGWDVSKVTNMERMFRSAGSFNQGLNDWNTSNVTAMSRMFSGASSFNQPIGNWDTGNVKGMSKMFRAASSFNQDIGNWNTTYVWLMNFMFWNATSFNQDLSGWCVQKISKEPWNFDIGANAWTLPRPAWGTCP